MTSRYSLVFKGDHNNTREIAKISALDEFDRPKPYDMIMAEASTIIHSFCSERNFRIYYTRLCTRDNTTIFDVGSHTEFFHLIPSVDLHYTREDVSHG